MGRRPLLPPELLHGPFTIAAARRAGLTRWHLEGESWKRLGGGWYVSSRFSESPTHDLEAARQRLPPEAAFSGLTAAWLHGLDVNPSSPIELTIPLGERVYHRAGLSLRHRALSAVEVVSLRGMRATSMLRTVIDLCGRLSLTEAVVIADAALHRRQIRLDQLKTWVESGSRQRYVRRVLRVLEYVEPASESPMETRLRMTLVLAGLPRPRAQVSIHDASGRFAGRPDLYYPDERLGIEYDGAVHKDSLAADDRRQNRLLGAGVRLLRFTASDVLSHPDSVVTQVEEMLEATRPGA